jgi:hypothetical protein
MPAKMPTRTMVVKYQGRTYLLRVPATTADEAKERAVKRGTEFVRFAHADEPKPDILNRLHPWSM